MTQEQRRELLAFIADKQDRTMPGNGTAPVTIQVGYVDTSNMVRDDGIVILEAPAAVVYAVVGWISDHHGNDLVAASMVDWDGPHSRTCGLLVR